MKYFVCLLFFCIGFAQTVSAKTEYAVTVPVDVEAENSVIAKEKAMLEAQRQAFMQISEQLVSKENAEKLEQLTDDELVHFVKSVGVADEKSGGKKYIANLTVQLHEQLLKDYLAENGMIQSETTDILVFPVFKAMSDSYALLWEENNIWRRSWQNKGLIKFGSMQIKTAYDSLREVDTFSAEDALYMENSLYEKIAQTAAIERIYVVYAEALADNDLKVTLKNEKDKTEDKFTVYGDDQENVFDKAIEKSVMFISNMEREADNHENGHAVKSISVVYMYQDMRDWLSKSRLIEELSQVEGVETKSFGGGKVNFSIQYTGSLEDIWTALQDFGISHDKVDNHYIIR